jgi:PAS domain S-box-containing protein
VSVVVAPENRGTMRNLLGSLAALRHARRSVSGKLMGVVLLTTASALVVAAIALLLSDLHENRLGLAADLETEARILELSTAPALAFDDDATARRNLGALQARESLRVAALYTPDGALYASYQRPGVAGGAPLRRPGFGPEALRIEGSRVELLRPVMQGRELLGTLYLRAEYDRTARVQAYLGILTVVLVASLGVAFLLSSWLQRLITGPLDSMASVARNVVERRDYALRAQRTTADEIGIVVDAFNDMLEEVQARTRALEESNAALQEQVAVRKATEQALRESERLYRAIGESINYGVWVCDAAGRNVYVSESFLRLTGLTQEMCADFRWARALHPDDAAETIAAWKACVAGQQAWYREHRILGVDGHYHPILAQGVPMRDEHGRLTGWAGINLDIGRLKQTEQALREADRRKDEFLATLAHELRNPLAPIRHAVRVLDAPGADEHQRRWGREVIARQVRQMALLLDDLLDVSRITRGQLELRRDYVELATIVEVARETARPLFEAKRHVLEVELPAAAVRLDVDPLRLSQVIGNLLTNAAKYTDAGGHVVLRAAVSGRDLVITVRDTGIGLGPEVIPRLFTMFSQVNSAIDRAEGGLGIGLALVKGLVALHGGHVEARSEGPGRGSEFVVDLPDVVVTRAAPLVDAPSAGEATVEAGAGRMTNRARVLVADDNRDAATTLAMMLELAGYRVSTAFSGIEALAAGAREQPQALLLDIGMPGLNGYETARRIRQEAWGRHVVLVAITGWGQEEDKRNATAAGFDLHLTKPVDPAQLEAALADALAGASSRDATAIAPGTASATASPTNA